MKEIPWKEFYSLLTEVATNKKYAKKVKELKPLLIECRCWKFEEPYSSWDNFYYNLSDVQIKKVYSALKEIIE